MLKYILEGTVGDSYWGYSTKSRVQGQGFELHHESLPVFKTKLLCTKEWLKIRQTVMGTPRGSSSVLLWNFPPQSLQRKLLLARNWGLTLSRHKEGCLHSVSTSYAVHSFTRNHSLIATVSQSEPEIGSGRKPTFSGTKLFLILTWVPDTHLNVCVGLTPPPHSFLKCG